MTALFVGFMRLLSFMPLSFIRAVGHFLGWLLWAMMKSRKHIVQTNLRLCFPEKPIEEIKQLTRAHFVQFAQSLLDRAWLWHAPLSVVESRLKWVGTPDAFSQLAADTPKIILAPHFVGLDAGGMALTLKASRPVAFIFVPQHNKVMDAWVNQGRQRTGLVKPYFRHEGAKRILNGLRDGEMLHLSPDMDFGPEESLFVPFMGVAAATVPSLSRFARLGRAQVLTLVTRMTPQGYEMTLQEAWDNFPTADLFDDTRRMNAELAEHVRATPSQYYWVHKRFKTRPEGDAPVYKKAAISR